MEVWSVLYLEVNLHTGCRNWVEPSQDYSGTLSCDYTPKDQNQCRHESNIWTRTLVQKTFIESSYKWSQTPHSPHCCCISLHIPLLLHKQINPHICCQDKSAHTYLIISKTSNTINKTLRNVPPRWKFYLIWSTFGSLWHHVDVSGLIVVHGYFTL